MSPGERKQLTLQPAEAYGAIRSKLIRRVPRTRFPANLSLWVGKRLMSVRAIAGGRRRRVTVIAIGPETVILDGNHPLAGMVIELDVMLVSIVSTTDGNGGRPPLDVGGEL
jgi:FKBP-type peptidyl-prolyl cis-trans isomerase SlyD